MMTVLEIQTHECLFSSPAHYHCVSRMASQWHKILNLITHVKNITVTVYFYEKLDFTIVPVISGSTESPTNNRRFHEEYSDTHENPPQS